MNVDSILAFIKENSKDIFAFVENNEYTPPQNEYVINNNDNIFNRLISNLIENFPICHCNPNNPLHREYDKVHYELSKAIIAIFWCGCLPQMKENREAYFADTIKSFEKLLFQTFQSGKEYGPIEEDRRKNFKK